MTRAEVIKCLKAMKRFARDIFTEERLDWQYSLDMAIKTLEQESILDKIKAEIETKYGQCDICEYFEDYDYEENDISEYRLIGNIADILQIIDNCKAESEVEDGECK